MSAAAHAVPAGRVLRADGPAVGAAPRIGPCDFHRPVLLTEGELRRLRAVHEDFARYLGARLSLALRLEFGVKLGAIEPATFSAFAAALPEPVHVTLFRAEPLAGTGLLAVTPRLALALADRLLGGRGVGVPAGRTLTDVEVALLEDTLGAVLEEWCALWPAEPALRPRATGHEASGRFLQTAPREASMLVLTLEAAFADCTEPIQLAVPLSLAEGLLRRLQGRTLREAPANPPHRTALAPALAQVPLALRAEWAVIEVSLRELACLRAGDLIELPAALLGETRLLVNGQPKFAGTAGLDGDRVAIQITRRLASPGPEPTPHPDGSKIP